MVTVPSSWPTAGVSWPPTQDSSEVGTRSSSRRERDAHGHLPRRLYAARPMDLHIARSLTPACAHDPVAAAVAAVDCGHTAGCDGAGEVEPALRIGALVRHEHRGAASDGVGCAVVTGKYCPCGGKPLNLAATRAGGHGHCSDDGTRTERRCCGSENCSLCRQLSLPGDPSGSPPAGRRETG